MADLTGDTKYTTWPYTSFKTLLNWVNRLAENKAVPPRIDRSILPGSEGQKTQVLAALKFFGLVKDNGDVDPLLVQLVEADDKERKPIVARLLAAQYPAATALAAVNATAKQLEETFPGLSGDTLRKATTFYLHAAKFANHPLSKNFKVQPLISRPAKRKPSNGGGGETPPPPSVTQPASSSDPKSRYLDLLMKKAETVDGALDTALLDRIEKLLGYPPEDAE